MTHSKPTYKEPHILEHIFLYSYNLYLVLGHYIHWIFPKKMRKRMHTLYRNSVTKSGATHTRAWQGEDQECTLYPQTGDPRHYFAQHQKLAIETGMLASPIHGYITSAKIKSRPKVLLQPTIKDSLTKKCEIDQHSNLICRSSLFQSTETECASKLSRMKLFLE